MRNKGSKDLNPRTMPDLESRIMLALISPEDKEMSELLGPEENNYYLRLKFLNNLYLQHYPQLSDKEIYRVYKKEYQVSDPTFYRDRNMCFRIFGPQLKPDLEYLKGIELQIAIRDRSLARAAGDWKTVVQFNKFIMELMGLNKPIVAKGEGDERPQQVITNIQINYGDGRTEIKPIDLTMLGKLKPEELDAFAELIDNPAVGGLEMEQILREEKNENDTTEA
jgi:hypothetical protein